MSGGEFVRFITLPQIHLAKLRASAQRLAMIAERLQSPDRTIDWPENGRHPTIGASGGKGCVALPRRRRTIMAKRFRSKGSFSTDFSTRLLQGNPFLFTSTQDFFHFPSLGQFVHQFVEIPRLLNQGIFNFFDSVSTNHALD
jgi:hypothetical protein